MFLYFFSKSFKFFLFLAIIATLYFFLPKSFAISAPVPLSGPTPVTIQTFSFSDIETILFV